MVKNKKILKRVAALGAVALLLLVGVAPALMPAANAMVVVPERDDDGKLLTPVLYQMAIPLDVLQSDVHGVVVDNPMFSIAVDNGYNQWTQIGMPNLEQNEDFFGDPLGIWDFHLSSLQTYGNKYYRAGFTVQFDSPMNSNEFTLRNSSPFIATVSEMQSFLAGFEYFLRPGYEIQAVVNIEAMFPRLVSDRGWQLLPARSRQTFVSSNMTDTPEYVNLMAAFDIYQFVYDALVEPSGDSKLLYVTDFSVSFSCVNSLSDGIGDSGSVNQYASIQHMNFLYSSPGSAHTFEEFFERYPGNRVIVSDNPGAVDFDLTVFLKNSVGSFMATEIIPGISFGGLLAVAIGLSLTVVFLKFFGG